MYIENLKKLKWQININVFMLKYIQILCYKNIMNQINPGAEDIILPVSLIIVPSNRLAEIYYLLLFAFLQTKVKSTNLFAVPVVRRIKFSF